MTNPPTPEWPSDGEPGAGAARPWDDVVRDLRRDVVPRGRHAAASAPVADRPVRGRRPGLRRVVLCLVVVGLLAAVVGVRVLGHGEPVADAEVAVAADRAVSWEQVLGRLDAARTAAWSSGDVGALRAVDVAGSRAEAADRGAMATLSGAGLAPRGLGYELTLVGVVTKSANRAVLRVMDRRGSYALVDRTGEVLVTVPARAERAWRVELRADEDGRWRYVEAKALGP